MVLPETTRQYLPDLEKRWGVPRKHIVEYARDEKLDLWIDLFDVKLLYKKEDGSKGEESRGNIELKFYLSSLEQLCNNIDMSKYYCTMQGDKGQLLNITNGILKDGRKVMVAHRQPVSQMGYKEPSRKILIEYSRVYALVEDVIHLEKLNPSNEVETSFLKLPYLDAGHEFYSQELALAVKTWLALYGEGGKYRSNQAHKEQIESTLQGEDLSKSATERIITLVNPQKKGGAPATGL